MNLEFKGLTGPFYLFIKQNELELMKWFQLDQVWQKVFLQ